MSETGSVPVTVRNGAEISTELGPTEINCPVGVSLVGSFTRGRGEITGRIDLSL